MTIVMSRPIRCEVSRFAAVPNGPEEELSPLRTPETALLLGGSRGYIAAAYPERFLQMLKSYAAAIILLCAGALVGAVDPALAQDRRVPASGAEVRLSYAPI